ncbi:MAG: dihydroneopterin aldolase [Crocinitomicaceae bacterium]
MNRIEVNGIKLYAYHGCLKEEGVIGGHYVVDVTIDTDFSVAAETDDLSNTVDYVDVNRIVTEEMAIRSKLIECVGWRIVEKIKALDNVANVTVKVTKLSPPINGDVNNVAIIIQE